MIAPSSSALAGLAERRIAPRFQPALGTVCRIARSNTDPAVVGLVWNISETGVSMLIGKPPKAGRELPAELTSELSGQRLAVTLRVVHVRPMQTGDYVLGAQFEQPLGSDEIQLFLAPPATTGSDKAEAPEKG